ncbi:hypothetical protein CH063_06786 [Colletotrichum higginsianum]|uniref:Uncharacterized protein n=1 Tax=Colletotrichum higginsianum (strain IMI 349063) TaxID=759273 RepID=H1V3S7_COLHI|nr:hypothetical protein CH063_06786 [Colletotrichum higginsianum]
MQCVAEIGLLRKLPKPRRYFSRSVTYPFRPTRCKTTSARLAVSVLGTTGASFGLMRNGLKRRMQQVW